MDRMKSSVTDLLFQGTFRGTVFSLSRYQHKIRTLGMFPNELSEVKATPRTSSNYSACISHLCSKFSWTDRSWKYKMNHFAVWCYNILYRSVSEQQQCSSRASNGCCVFWIGLNGMYFSMFVFCGIQTGLFISRNHSFSISIFNQSQSQARVCTAISKFITKDAVYDCARSITVEHWILITNFDHYYTKIVPK